MVEAMCNIVCRSESPAFKRRVTEVLGFRNDVASPPSESDLRRRVAEIVRAGLDSNG